jgi:SAM-dependent methyltransferase
MAQCGPPGLAQAGGPHYRLSMAQPESVQAAYDRYAAVYDEFNAQNNYELWLGEALLPELEKRGLQKGWALDVGCGTGRAFDPLLERGWQVVGCDVSTGMLAEAERKFGSRVPLHNLDARELPAIYPSDDAPASEGFDLVVILNDVVNYLIEDGDLERLFASVKRNLNRDHGLAIFDASTFALFQAIFTSETSEEMNSRGFEWRGLTEKATPGIVHEARLSGSRVDMHVHRQRHWTAEEIRAALAANGLQALAALGQSEENGRILLADPADEEKAFKVIYIVAPA